MLIRAHTFFGGTVIPFFLMVLFI